MGKLLLRYLIAINLGMVGSLWAGLTDVQITVEKKTDKDVKKAAKGEGDTGVLVIKANYNFKLAVAGFNDLSDLTVDYIVFVERQKVGRKKEEDVVVRISGSQAVPLLTKKAPQVVTSKEIELNKSNLVGNFYYANGGRVKAEDNVKGVWVRVSRGGQIIGEYINPTTISKLGWEPK